MEEKTLEQKYDLARMALMLIERMTMAIRIGHIDDLPGTILHIGNMCHVVNHENGEQTFDCGPNTDEHHAAALEEFRAMERAMYCDIAHGVDYSQMMTGKRSTSREEVEFNEVEPLRF